MISLMERKQDLVHLDAENCDIFICIPQWSERTNVLGIMLKAGNSPLRYVASNRRRGKN